MRLPVSLTTASDCFVSLPPAIAQSLHEKTKSFPIPLKLKWINEESGRSQTAYVGWVGSGSSGNAVEIGQQFARHLNLATMLKDNSFPVLRVQEVEISSAEIKDAKTIQVEPVSEDDWEIMESNADYFEEQILNQISVVYDQQSFPLHVHHRTILNLRVVGVEPKGSPCLRLQRDVELYVTPKPRKKKESEAETQPNATKTCLMKIQPGKASLKEEEQEYAFIHPATMKLLGWKENNVIQVTALQKPLSFSMIEKKMRKTSSTGESKKGEEKEAKRLFRCLIRESERVVPQQIILPYEARIEYEIEERTRVIVQFVAPRVNKKISLYKVDTEKVSQRKQEVTDGPARILGGFRKETSQLQHFLLPILCKPEEKNSLFRFPIPPLAIVSGKHGAGKTSLVQHILAQNVAAPFFVFHHTIHFDTLVHRNIHAIQRYISEAVQSCRLNQPSILVFESVDAIVVTDQQGEYSILAEQLSEFLGDLMLTFAEEKHQIAFFMTTSSLTALHKSLRSSRLCNVQIELQAPTLEQRIEILESLISSKKFTIDPIILSSVAKRCEGYLPADLEQLLDRAVHQSSFRLLSDSYQHESFTQERNISKEDFETAQEAFTPASLKGIKFVKSDKTWEDVGALDKVKDLLKETFEWPSKYATLFRKCPLKLRRGLLLYGPPGCGKTLIASAVAQECNLNFISVKGPELLNKYIGASEQAVRDLFDQAAAAKPCILFFDEFDSIAPRRGHDNTGVTDRVVNQLLTQLDGVESISSVYVLAATSRPDLIDPALLRPGRLDKCLYCGIPSERDREKILVSVSRKVQIAPDVSFSDIARMTKGYTGADLHALLHNAQLEVVHHLIDGEKKKISSASKKVLHNGKPKILEFGNSKMNRAERGQLLKKLEPYHAPSGSLVEKNKDAEAPQLVVTAEHIATAFAELRPSVSPAERQKYETIYEDFLASRGTGAAPGSGSQKATQA